MSLDGFKIITLIKIIDDNVVKYVASEGFIGLDQFTCFIFIDTYLTTGNARNIDGHMPRPLVRWYLPIIEGISDDSCK